MLVPLFLCFLIFILILSFAVHFNNLLAFSTLLCYNQGVYVAYERRYLL